MRRCVTLATIIATGALCCAMSVLAQEAQPPSAAALAALKIEKVKEGLYVITGSAPGDTFSGGNTAVFITDVGVTLVDTKLPGFGPSILDRIKTVTTKPITRIINTHAHGDHTGNNQFFGASVETIIHENADAALQKSSDTRPRRTYRDKLSLGSGKFQVDLYHFGRGHTDGDTFVVFTGLRAMHAGDMFAWKALHTSTPRSAAAPYSIPRRWPPRSAASPTSTRSSPVTPRWHGGASSPSTPTSPRTSSTTSSGR